VRIIAGQFRGRPLQAPAGLDTRPTTDRVREALFSMLASRLGSFDELRVADLYAGSGALGLEALSRGAAHATFVESDARAQTVIKANLAKLGLVERAHVIGGSALKLPRSDAFDLVLADPPYGPGSGSAVVSAVADADWLASGGWMSVEGPRGERIDPLEYCVELERDFGRAKLTLLRRP